MSRTKEWLMDQHDRDLDLARAENANLRDLVRQMLAAGLAVMGDLNDDQTDAWVRPDVRRQLIAAIARAKGESEC